MADANCELAVRRLVETIIGDADLYELWTCLEAVHVTFADFGLSDASPDPEV